MRLAAVCESEAMGQNRYDRVDSIPVSRGSIAEKDDQARLDNALSELTSRIRIQQRRVQARSLFSVRVRSARRATNPQQGETWQRTVGEVGHRHHPRRRELRISVGPGEDEELEKEVSQGVESYTAAKARMQDAVSRTLP